MRSGRRARALLILLTILGLIGLSGPARAQYTGSLTVSDTTLVFGQSATATAQNLETNRAYTLRLEQNPTAVLDTGTTNASGTVTFGFTIPLTGFSAGAARLEARPTTGTGASARQNVTLLAAQASPSPSPTAAPTARLVPNRNTYTRGQAGTAAGSGLQPSESYHIDFIQSPGINLDVRSTNVAGAVTFAFRIPSGARNGSATLRAHPVDNSGAVATASITITGAGTGGVTLPKTGRNIMTYVGLGIVLFVLGWLMIMYVRARRRAGAPGRHPSRSAETTKV